MEFNKLTCLKKGTEITSYEESPLIRPGKWLKGPFEKSANLFNSLFIPKFKGATSRKMSRHDTQNAQKVQ